MDIYAKKMKTLIRKDICTPMFIATLFTMAKIWKQPKYPSVDCDTTHKHTIHTMEYHLAIKKKEIFPLTSWFGIMVVMLSKISQREK